MPSVGEIVRKTVLESLPWYMAFGLGLNPLTQTPPNELWFPAGVSDLVKLLPAHTGCGIRTPSSKH